MPLLDTNAILLALPSDTTAAEAASLAQLVDDLGASGLLRLHRAAAQLTAALADTTASALPAGDGAAIPRPPRTRRPAERVCGAVRTGRNGNGLICQRPPLTGSDRCWSHQHPQAGPHSDDDDADASGGGAGQDDASSRLGQDDAAPPARALPSGGDQSGDDAEAAALRPEPCRKCGADGCSVRTEYESGYGYWRRCRICGWRTSLDPDTDDDDNRTPD